MGVYLTDEFVTMAFTMSKQSYVVNDFEEIGNQALQKLNFSEYLEFIARISVLRFLNTEMEGISLDEKIGYFMDIAFLYILNEKRQFFLDDIYVSESDNEY